MKMHNVFTVILVYVLGVIILNMLIALLSNMYQRVVNST